MRTVTLSLLSLLALLSTPAFGQTQTPPSPPPLPPPLVPCMNNSGEGCRMIYVAMIINHLVPRAFTIAELGGTPPRDGSICQGRLMRGSIRYFVNGTAPSAMIGTLVPPAPETPEDQRDPTGTLELDGDVILLYDAGLIAGFKAIAATTEESEVSWDCQL